MATIIGINGVPGAGKDTFAAYLAEELAAADPTQILPLAGAIRVICLGLGFLDLRETKEVTFNLAYDDVSEDVQDAIDVALPGAAEEDRAELYAFLTDLLGEACADTNTITASYRTMAQAVGEAGRKVRASFWLDAHKDARIRTGFVIVPDVRYVDESLICDELIHIDRPGYWPVNGHESETNYETLRELSTIHVTNGGPPHDLQSAALSVARGIIYNTVG